MRGTGQGGVPDVAPLSIAPRFGVVLTRHMWLRTLRYAVIDSMRMGYIARDIIRAHGIALNIFSRDMTGQLSRLGVNSNASRGGAY